MLTEAAKTVEAKKEEPKQAVKVVTFASAQANSTEEAKPAAVAPKPETAVKAEAKPEAKVEAKPEAKVEAKAPSAKAVKVQEKAVEKAVAGPETMLKSDFDKMVKEAHDKG
jgi:hypothetical protein